MDAKVSFTIPEEPENGEAEEYGSKYGAPGMKPQDRRVQHLRGSGGRGRSGSQKSEDGSQISRSETGRRTHTTAHRQVGAPTQRLIDRWAHPHNGS